MKFSKELMKQIVLLMIIAMVIIMVVKNGGTVLGGLKTLLAIITPFIAGGVIAFILNIPMTAIEEGPLRRWNGTKKEKFKRPLSMLTTIIMLFAVIGLLIIIIVPNLANAFGEIIRQFPVFLDNASKWLYSLHIEGLEDNADFLANVSLDLDSIYKKVITFVTSGAGQVLGSTVQLFSSIVTTVVSTAIAFIFSLYALSQKEKLARQSKKLLKAYLPEKYERWILKVCHLLRLNFKHFITGQCLDAMILGALFLIVLSIFRMPYPLMIGVIIAFTALIPLVGAFLGCAISVFLILMISPIKVLYFLIIFIVLQQCEGKLIYPRVVGGSVGLPAIWVLVAIAVGGSLFGVVGMLAFIPLVSTIYTLLREDVNRRISAKD